MELSMSSLDPEMKISILNLKFFSVQLFSNFRRSWSFVFWLKWKEALSLKKLKQKWSYPQGPDKFRKSKNSWFLLAFPDKMVQKNSTIQWKYHAFEHFRMILRQYLCEGNTFSHIELPTFSRLIVSWVA